MKGIIKNISGVLFVCFGLVVSLPSVAVDSHPNPVITTDDVSKMRAFNQI